MERTLSKLKSIEKRLKELNSTMNRESRVFRKELEERLRLGLTGDAAINHYNEWMTRYGMNDLIVK